MQGIGRTLRVIVRPSAISAPRPIFTAHELRIAANEYVVLDHRGMLVISVVIANDDTGPMFTSRPRSHLRYTRGDRLAPFADRGFF